MTAAILCGGLGTRLRSVVSDRPKVLADVGGRPFLSILLQELADQDVRRAILCTGYLADSLKAAFGERFGPIELSYSHEETPLGTGGALALASRGLAPDQLLLALNGDSRCALDVAALVQCRQQSGAAAALAVCEVPDTTAFGRVTIDPRGRVCAFEEKGISGPGWVNAGVYLFPVAWLHATSQGRPISLERELLPSWLARGVQSCPLPGPLVDIGTPESYAAARRAAH